MNMRYGLMLREFLGNSLSDKLFANSLYLFSSTVVMSVLGFVFWLINSHLFSAQQVGLATTLISVMTLITNFSMIGLNIGLIKYLPLTDQRSDRILSVVTTVSAMLLPLRLRNH